MAKTFKIRLTDEVATELVGGEVCKTVGYGSYENMLPTGAKLKPIGSGWWLVVGYHPSNLDTNPYLIWKNKGPENINTVAKAIEDVLIERHGEEGRTYIEEEFGGDVRSGLLSFKAQGYGLLYQEVHALGRYDLYRVAAKILRVDRKLISYQRPGARRIVEFLIGGYNG